MVHLKRSPDCFRVDRASPLGNPFPLRQESDRPLVCRAHKEYLWLLVNPESRSKVNPDLPMEPIEAIHAVLARHPGLTLVRGWKIPSRDEFMAALGALRDAAIAATEDRPLKIGCHCAPKPCHGDSYAAWLGYVDRLEAKVAQFATAPF